MAGIKIDLSKFKHVKTDANTTTLKHADGHTITMHHPSLSPNMQKQLSALSKLPVQDETPLEKDELKHKMASGRKISQFAQGTPDQPLYKTSGFKPKPQSQAPEQEESSSGNIEENGSAIDKAHQDIVNKAKQHQTEHPEEYEAEGGEVKESNPKLEQSKKLPQHKPPIHTQPDTGERPDAGYGKVIRKAEGGNVCKHCGGEVHQYADGTPDQPVSQDDTIKPQIPVSLAPDLGPVQQDFLNTALAQSAQEAPKPEQPGLAARAGAHLGRSVTQAVKDTGAGVRMVGNAIVSPIANFASGFSQGADEGDPSNPPGQQPDQANVSSQMPDKAPAGGVNTQLPPDAPAQAAGPFPTTPSGTPTSPEGMFTQGLQAQMQAERAKATATTDLGKQQAELEEARAKSEQQAADLYNSAIQATDADRQGHIADIQNGYIDPNKYWTGYDVNTPSGVQHVAGHSKIASGIGMILAGFNPAGQPNAVMNMLKSQMEQSLQAQGKNLDSSHNLLRANLEHYRDIRSATEMTRVLMNDALSHQLQMAASKAAGPMAKANALGAIGKLQTDNAAALQSFNMRQTMIKMATDPNINGPQGEGAFKQFVGLMRAVDPKQAKDWEDRYVDGVGLSATHSIPDAARNQIIAMKDLNNLYNQSLDMSAKYSGIEGLKQALSNPVERQKINAQGATLQNQLIGVIKQAQHDGVYKESEAEYLLKQIGGEPTSIFSKIKSEPKIQELMDISQGQYSNLLKTWGLPQQQLPRTQSQAPQYKTVKGVRYMRGPNGEAVPVK